MKRSPLMFALLSCAMAMPLFAQQLQQPTVPTSKPVTPARNTGVGPQLKQVPTAPPAVPSNPTQRPATTSPVPSTGPAQDLPAGPDARTLQKGRPTSVLDVNGRPVNGMLQVAPNRVYDPATGRYHWTDNSGGQQKLKD